MRAKGVDLSRYNGRGNWQKVRDAGVDFAIIKAGGIYSVAGTCYEDVLLDDHVSGARSVGIPFGLYWYFLPFMPVMNQAEYFLNLIDLHKPELPIAVDVESANGVDAKMLSSALKTFLTLLQGAGHKPMIYTRASFFNVNTIADPFWGQFELWAARYRSDLTLPWSDGSWKFRDWDNWRFWQWSADNNAQARNYGFPGNPEGDPDIDLNVYNGTVDELYTWAGLTPPVMTLEERVARLERAVFGGG